MPVHTVARDILESEIPELFDSVYRLIVHPYGFLEPMELEDLWLVLGINRLDVLVDGVDVQEILVLFCGLAAGANELRRKHGDSYIPTHRSRIRK